MRTPSSRSLRSLTEEVEKRVLLILIWPDSALSRRGGGGGVDPDRAGGFGLVRPQEVRDQEAGGEVRGRDAEGPLAAAVQGGEALLDFEQGLHLDGGQGLDHPLAPGPQLFQIPYHLGAAALVSAHKGILFSCASRKRRRGSLACMLFN